MSQIRLRDLRSCFEGMVPATMTTASPEGVPNVNNLSKVDYVDETHVALSRQFFRKSAKNLEVNPYACILLTEPASNRNFKLHVRLERIDTEGPVFDQMKIRIDAIAALTGMEGVFRLEAAFVFEVESIGEVEGAIGPTGSR
jgi:adenylate cyclase